MKNLVRRYFKITVYLITVFLFQEITFRYFFPVPEIINFDRINYMRLDFSGEGSIHARNKARNWKSFPDTSAIFQHKMNQYSFRDKEWIIEKPVGKQRAIFIGDSFIEGIMANQNETVSSAFKEASKDQEYEAFNAGMLGCGLDSYLQLAADITPVYQPDVVFLCIYANDLGKNKPIVPQYYLDPEYFNFYTPRLQEQYKQSKTYGPLHFRWDKSSEAYFPAVPEKGNPWSSLEKNLTENVEPWLAEEMKKGNFNPFLTNSLLKEERYLKNPPPLGETIPFFNYTCNQSRVKPVVIYIPSRNQVSTYYLQFEKKYCLSLPDSLNLTMPEYQIHQQIIAEQCKQFNIQFIDLTTVVKEREDKGEHLYWDYDQHMRAKGYKLLGETIWQEFTTN